MNELAITPELIKGATDFHGHWCPGLAIGIRAAEWALGNMGRASDEEIVAVVETDMCAVDAVQYLTGCTFGKGNLVYRDYGKNAFTFYRRRDGKSARLVTRSDCYGPAREEMTRLNIKKMTVGLNPEEEGLWHEARAQVSKYILETCLKEIFEIKEAAGPEPRKARILKSLTCEDCGEAVMETRTRRMHEKNPVHPLFRSQGQMVRVVLRRFNHRFRAAARKKSAC